MFRTALVMLSLTALPVQAQSVGYFQCSGQFPDWGLSLQGDTALLRLDGQELRLSVPQVSRAEGRDTPLAATLIEGYDTAIIVLDHAQCQLGDVAFPMRGHLLTQRGNSPILLTGCCRPDR